MKNVDDRVNDISKEYAKCLAIGQVREDDRKWYPRWFGSYVAFHRLQYSKHPVERMPMNMEMVVAFLQSLRDRSVKAWQRLQAVEALYVYHVLVHRDDSVDFTLLRTKLRELSELERRTGDLAQAKSVVPGEGSEGELDDDEPKSVIDMRKKLRLLHHPVATERAYISAG